MALQLETGIGSLVSETLVTEEEFVEFCAKRGITITEQEAAPHLVKAMDWIAYHEPKLVGNRSVVGQALPFPREGLTIFNLIYASDTIPQQAKLAQTFAAIASFNGVELLPVSANGQQLISKKVGPIEKEWAYDPNKSTAPVVPQALGYLSLMFADNGFRFNQRA